MPVLDACEDVEAEVLFEEPILVVAGARSSWADGSAETLRDLAAAPWILGPPGTAVRRLVADAFRAEGLEPPAAAVSTHSMQLRMQLLAEDDYVSSLPASLLRVNGTALGPAGAADRARAPGAGGGGHVAPPRARAAGAPLPRPPAGRDTRAERPRRRPT